MPTSNTLSIPNRNATAKRIMILGGGFGGFHTLLQLMSNVKNSDNAKITIVSDENYFLFSPLLHAVAAGGIETRHITFPIRRLSSNDKFTFIQANVERIDLDNLTVTTNLGTFDFDYLVLALGGITNTEQLEDIVREERKIFFIKTLYDSMLIRNHVLKVFELASTNKNTEYQRQLLTFVICGGGYTGVQMASELRDFINRSLLKFYRSIDPSSIRIMIIETTSRIVGDLHAKLCAYATETVQRLGIVVRLESRVTGVWKDRIEINGSEMLPTDTLIWATGVVANPKVADLNVSRDAMGRVVVNEFLQVNNFPQIYAVGDCAHFLDPQSSFATPPRAHNAVRQAKIAAYNILADIRGEHMKAYRPNNSGEVVFLGATKAVFRFYGFRMYGRLAYFIGLVGYSLLIKGFYSRIRVIIDWVLFSIFGRDTTFLRQIE